MTAPDLLTEYTIKATQSLCAGLFCIEQLRLLNKSLLRFKVKKLICCLEFWDPWVP